MGIARHNNNRRKECRKASHEEDSHIAVVIRADKLSAGERDMIYEGMLNYDTLSEMLFTIDLRTGRMWAKLNR